IRVQLDATGLTTEADLLLSAGVSPTDVWRLLTPRGAVATVKSVNNDKRLQADVKSESGPAATTRTTIHLKHASKEPLRVHVKVSAPPPRNGTVVAIGPFHVLDAARQTGTVEVRNRLRNLHLDYRGQGDMKLQRPPSKDSNGETVASLSYQAIPLPANPKGATGANSLSWLDLLVEAVHPRLQKQVAHVLTLRLTQEGGCRWDLVTTIKPAGKWSDGEELKILVPSQWKSSDENISVTPGSNPSVVIPFSMLRDPVKLMGHYDGDDKAEGRAVLHLPRPQGSIEKWEARIEAPADYEIVVHNAAQHNLEALKPPRPNEQTWGCGKVAADARPSLDASWRPYRPLLRTTAVADVTLNGNRAEVRHEMRLQLPPSPPAFVALRLPPEVQNLTIASPGWTRDEEQKKDGLVWLRPPPSPPQSAEEWRLVLNYSALLGRQGETLTVPLTAPEQAVGDIKVRVWSEARVLPRPVAGRNWEERPIEVVKDRAELPVLVLHGVRLDAPLLLRTREQAPRYSVLVESASLRVQVLENGAQKWHVCYRIHQLADHRVEIQLPSPVLTRNAQFLFNKQKVTPEAIDDEGNENEAGSIARLRLPELARQPGLLEVSFQASSGRGGNPLRTILQPPQVRGAAVVPARWQVSVPGNRVLIAPESGAGVERTWTRRGWLLAAGLHDNDDEGERPTEGTPALICWQDQAEPLVLTHAPQQGWLLLCSLALLIVGLGLYWTARPQGGDDGRMAVWFWPLLAVLILSAALGILFWPTTLWAILYGCQPGALVLLLVVALQWTMYRRYRRQIVFLPSFSRARSGSSLVRPTASPLAVNGEPSTVDAPPPNGVK
ncbi:MAG: hypothetical protein ACRELF_07995, partial [Gemmataceae bacterium]